MLSGLLISVILFFSVLFFNAAYAVYGTQSAYLGLYKGIVENNVMVVAEHSDSYAPTPFFDMDGLRRDLDEYFALNLKYCARSYSFEVKGKARRYAGLIDAVRINLDVQMTLTLSQSYTAVFALEKR